MTNLHLSALIESVRGACVDLLLFHVEANRLYRGVLEFRDDAEKALRFGLRLVLLHRLVLQTHDDDKRLAAAVRSSFHASLPGLSVAGVEASHVNLQPIDNATTFSAEEHSEILLSISRIKGRTSFETRENPAQSTDIVQSLMDFTQRRTARVKLKSADNGHNHSQIVSGSTMSSSYTHEGAGART